MYKYLLLQVQKDYSINKLQCKLYNTELYVQ